MKFPRLIECCFVASAAVVCFSLWWHFRSDALNAKNATIRFRDLPIAQEALPIAQEAPPKPDALGAMLSGNKIEYPDRRWLPVIVKGAYGKECQLMFREDDPESVLVLNDSTCQSVKQKKRPHTQQDPQQW